MREVYKMIEGNANEETLLKSISDVETNFPNESLLSAALSRSVPESVINLILKKTDTFGVDEKVNEHMLMSTFSDQYSVNLTQKIIDIYKAGEYCENSFNRIAYSIYKNNQTEKVLVVLSALPFIAKRHLYDAINKKFSDDVIIKIIDKVFELEEMHSYSSLHDNMSTPVTEAYIKKQFEKGYNRIDLLLTLAIEKKCSEDIVLDIINDDKSKGREYIDPSEIELAIKNNYSEKIIKLMIDMNPNDLTDLADLASEQGYSKSIVKLLETNHKTCVIQ